MSDITVASLIYVDAVFQFYRTGLSVILQYVGGFVAAERDAVRMRNGTSKL